MDELMEFMAARLDEEEAIAQATGLEPPHYQWSACGPPDWSRVEDERENVVVTADPVIASALATRHIALHDPARVLREVEVKRAILALHRVYSEPERWGDSHPDWRMRGQATGGTTYWCEECDHDRDYGHIGGPDEGCRTLRHLAAIWSDHPDYRAEWKLGAPDGPA